MVWETWQMSKTYHCLPTDLWQFDPKTPKGYYFNRGVYYFGSRIESDMNSAEARSRRGRNGVTADRLSNAARLHVLEKYLGVPIKRNRDPGAVTGDSAPVVDAEHNKDDGPIVLKKGF